MSIKKIQNKEKQPTKNPNNQPKYPQTKTTHTQKNPTCCEINPKNAVQTKRREWGKIIKYSSTSIDWRNCNITAGNVGPL